MAEIPHFEGNSNRIRVGSRVTLFKMPGSPNWYIDYSLDGKQHRRTTKTSSLKHARTIAQHKDAELVLGQAKPPDRSKLKIFDITEDYILTLKRKNRAPATLDDYRRYLRQFGFFAKAKGITRLDRVRAELLEECQDRLSVDGLDSYIPDSEKHGRKLSKNKPKTIRDKLKVVRQLMKWALRRGFMYEDPAKDYSLPPEPEPSAKCWDQSELRAIFTEAGEVFVDLFKFFSLTGLRSSELCWLLKEDVNLGKKPFIVIRNKRCPITGLMWWPKKKKNRMVPLCPQAVEIARKALAASPGPWLFWGGKRKGSPAGRFTPRLLLAGLKAAMKAAKVTEGVIHTFRHVFCSFMANNKVPALKVMKILGHGNLEIVLIYYHLTDDELLASFDDLDFERLVGPDARKETA